MRPFRYDFFTVWSSGLPHIDDILEILRQEDDLRIRRIEQHRIRRFRKFVFDMYSCDHVPVLHLQSKLAYLLDLEPEVVNIFVENRRPLEVSVGQGRFRKVQCRRIVDIKNRIRNQFNPMHSDPEFQVDPLDRGVSHEHVIHASDSEEQVDHYLKLMGNKKGIGLLDSDSAGLPFDKPHHLRRPTIYSLRTIRTDSLLARIRTGTFGAHDRETHLSIMPLSETPHFVGLTDDIGAYEDYVDRYRFQIAHDDHHVARLLSLRDLSTSELESLSPILVSPYKGGHVILDGVHRAAVHKARGREKVSSVVFHVDAV